jgi:NitT/TauT family transport system substrate-binding protein
MQSMQSRRRFLAGGAMACAASVFAAPRPLRAEPSPETTTVRLWKAAGPTCGATRVIVGDLLRAEGFTDVRYVDADGDFAAGDVDFSDDFTPAHILMIESGVPITVLAGIHSGCLELIANDSVRSVADLKGKRIGMEGLTQYPHVLMTLKAAYVGVDPERDIQWVTDPDATALQLFADGKIDAFFAIPPVPQDARARKIGHTILSTTVDRPWSQYFCCMLAGTTDYVTSYPVATKRVLRAMLKAVDLCVSNPKMVAQELVDAGVTDRYDYALATLTDLRFDRWREFDAEDTIRFYSLRMREGGLIKSSPQKIIADGTDWRFLDELKRELKT